MSPQNDPQAPSSGKDPAQLRRTLKRAAVAGGCVVAIIIAVGAYVRFSQADTVQHWTAQAEIPTVALVTPAASGKNQAIVFPGTLQAYYDANIYSRVSGYVHAWYQDIGAHVKKDQLLATIDTPDLDQQIANARANLNASVAAQKLALVTAQRWEDLLKQGAVARQDADTKEEALESANATVKASQASLDQFLAEKNFARIVAPFDGIVTKRTIDVGALVNNTLPTTPDPLFVVSDVHELRLYVNVPQNYSTEIVPGAAVTMSVPEYPGRTFPAKMVSNANAINSQSSLLVEFEVDNSQGLLKPGEYAEVNLGLPSTGAMLRLPSSALMFRAAGLEVATVGRDNRIVMKPITVATDLGTQVIVGSGLTAADRVVNNPPDSLSTGDRVRIAPPSQQGA
ncbi:MAG TPA: efflux RND transporter periplasmic adaptor subunit [Rhizomicrobium sp.]|nr:efflux RND transporter periplasmic adaptor subunit [Rhizomicrobium sp.]